MGTHCSSLFVPRTEPQSSSVSVADVSLLSPIQSSPSQCEECIQPTEREDARYNMNHTRRGRAIIFNHMYFDPGHNLSTRHGTNVDRDSLSLCLKQLHFQVEVFNDLPVRDIEGVLERAALEDHRDADCIVVAVLTHGELGILYGRDSPYQSSRLWTHFSGDKCPSLVGKPKIFFLQACQGDHVDPGVRIARTDQDAVATSYKIPSQADFLIVYSTIPGYKSWRNTTAGSWFIQALVQELEREADTRDLLSILTMVSRRVGYTFQSNVRDQPEMDGCKQIPCVSSMLTREIVFTNKETIL